MSELNSEKGYGFHVYISSATKLFNETELVELLQQVRKNNIRNGITRMLRYSNGNFIQVIEGEEDKVQSLHQKIRTDPRHSNYLHTYYAALN